MIKLSFNQRVWLGFVVIIVLISASSISSLFNLDDINESTDRVNNIAVPVQSQSNETQIQLLKQAKLSALAFTARTEAQITKYQTEYEFGKQRFNELFAKLSELAEQDEQMKALTAEANGFYQDYVNQVNDMFEAKLNILRYQAKAQEEFTTLTGLLDEAGAILLDISYYEAASDKEQKALDLFNGEASRIDGQLIGFINVFKEINNQKDLEVLGRAEEGIRYAFSDMDVRINFAGQSIVEVNTDGLWDDFNAQVEALKERALSENNDTLVYYKIQQLKETEKALEKLDASEASVTKVVQEFDNLLELSDGQFNKLQSEVIDNLALGTNSAIITWLILVLLASQNFNSMRKAIEKKMQDLAKINTTGQNLATVTDKTVTLEEILKVMHEQTGVEQGSVYLLNRDEQLEVKAYYPPKQMEEGVVPRRFNIGEGILGRTAETKRIIFIPNTHKDDRFVKEDLGDRPPRALLCVPLVDQDVLVGVMNFNGDVSKVRFEDSDYSFASSMARLLVSKINNIRQREVIEEQNRTLERKVEERTAELQQKNNDIAAMMENMHQGLFTITQDGLIHHEYAQYLESIFETDKIAQRNYSDLLLTNTDLGSDVINQIETAIDSMMGMDEMMWEFNSHLLAEELVKTMKDGREKILELDWDPIYLDDEIDKIMVTVRDVTELKALQKEAEAQRQELEVIGQIIAITEAKFDEFIRTSIEFVDKCRELIESNDDKDQEVVAALFRNMHTVKGNARTHGFTHITNSVHEAENTYDELRKDPDKQWDKQQLLVELEAADKDIKHYQYIAREKLGRTEGSATEQFDNQEISSLLSSTEALNLDQAPTDVKAWVQQAYQMFISNEANTIEHIIPEVIESTVSLANELGKPAPKVNINSQGLLIKKTAHSMLNNIFMHVFRNAMDHGIESPDDRQQKGKAEQGNITLDCSLTEQGVEISVQDDGRGIAISKIYQMAIEKGLYSESDPRPAAHEIANLIFSSGFSTAEEVTEVSGRGVGMDAVKQFLEGEGGAIELVLEPGDEDADFRAFKTYIRLPLHFYQAMPAAFAA